MRQGTSLACLARVFLRLGTTAFGGPAAHIAMMEDEVVGRRGWLTHDQFLDYLGAANLIPGPNSTELVIHIGYAQAGWRGLLVAGASFILPAALIVTAIAVAYVEYGALPKVVGILYGIKPVVIAIVAQAIWRLGQSAVKTTGLALLGVAATVSAAAGMNEIAVLLAAGGICAIVQTGLHSQHRSMGALVATGAGISKGAAAAVSASFGLWPLFLVFAKIGAVLFGSGYVLIAFLRADLVERLGWLTEQQLLDAVAVGQITPGPVFTTATFVGYVLGGAAGAAVATVGIFLPAFVFVALSAAFVPRLRRSATAGAMLDGVNVASLALMVVAVWQLGRVALPDALTMGIAGLSVFALVRYRINSAWLIAAGGVIGWLSLAAQY